ncbi:molybdopterin-dependent oxidoreductase, partial [Gammaproteobacteria bacterium]|nr:molybdopterin-dependent oxidoreductase [Gammaproteobacteria bacterium]
IRLNLATKNKTRVHSFNFNSLDENFDLHCKKIIDHSNIESFLNVNNIELDQGKTLIIIGPSVSRSPNQSNILQSISKFSSSIDAKIGFLTESCNSTSGWLLGNVPHRELGGNQSSIIGKNSYQMITDKLPSYILYNLEPEHDFFDKSLVESALESSECNIFFTSYITPMIEKYAHIIVPITTFAEADGSYINIEGTYQTFRPIVQPSKNIYEGWSILNKILKLNNLGDYSVANIRDELKKSLEGLDFNMSKTDMSNTNISPYIENKILKESYRETNQTDLIVRRSESLNQATKIKNKLNYKNMNNEVKKSYIDITK